MDKENQVIDAYVEKLVGKRGFWRWKDCQFPVEILNAERFADRIDYRIKPVGGSGSFKASNITVTIENSNETQTPANH